MTGENIPTDSERKQDWHPTVKKYFVTEGEDIGKTRYDTPESQTKVYEDAEEINVGSRTHSAMGARMAAETYETSKGFGMDGEREREKIRADYKKLQEEQKKAA